MSEKKRWPRDEGMKVALQLQWDLFKFCHKIEIAGSLRRGRPDVGDIELLYVPRTDYRLKPGEMFEQEQYSMADDLIDSWLKTGIVTKRLSVIGVATWGKENKLAVHMASGIPVDFFSTDESRWWTALVIRTGSAQTNIRLTTGAQRLGRHLHAYGSGVSEHGTLYPAKSEKDVFDLCGIPYLEPKNR